MDALLIAVTLVSLTLAGLLGTLALRLIREERRRSDARVAALAAEIRGGESLPLREVTLRRAPDPVVMSGDLFAGAQPAASGSRLAIVVGIGALVVAGAASAAVMLGGHRAAPPVSPTTTRPAQPTP